MAGKVWDWVSNKTRRFVEDIGNKLRGLATKMTTIWGSIKASAHQKWNGRLRILYGIINSAAYISFDVIWIRIQFKAAANSLSWRIVYGDSPIGEWTQLKK